MPSSPTSSTIPANPEAHYDDDGSRALGADRRAHHALRRSAGTGGTATGVGRYLKERNPAIRVILGDPQGSILAEKWRTHGEAAVEGTPYKVEGIGQDKIPGTLDLGLVDEFHTVSDRDSFAMARRLTREEGLFVGGSSGLIAHVALDVARRVDDPSALVVTFLCDTGERYLSKLYNDEWMRENRMLDPRPGDARRSPARRKTPTGPAVVGAASGVDRAASIRLMRLARCVPVASDGPRPVRGVHLRLGAVGEEPGGSEGARCDGERCRWTRRSRCGLEPIGRFSRQAAVENEPCRAGHATRAGQMFEAS